MIDEALRDLREKRKISAKDIAHQVGVSTKIYYNWESGITSVPIEYITSLSKALNVPVDYLLNYKAMSFEEYTQKYDTVRGIINAIDRNKDNKDFILWLFTASDIDIDGLVLFSTAYGSLPRSRRKHLSAVSWYVFRDAYLSENVVDVDIAKRLFDAEKRYKNLWKELNDLK